MSICSSSSSSSATAVPPPPSIAAAAAAALAVTVPYFCPKHVALATRERPPFPLFFKRCRDCRLDGIHEMDLPNYYSSSAAAVSSSVLAAPSSPRTLPLPLPTESSAYVFLHSSRSSTVWAVPRQSGLRSVTVSGDDDAAVVCAVCTDDIPPPATACRLPCGHMYHSDCFVQWLAQRNSCPVCRRRVPVFPDHGGDYTVEENSPSPLHTTTAADHRRRSLLGSRWIGKIFRRLLTYVEMSRPRQPN
uniref:RING-type domain-containing protein n=1 Tax=Leersia perrieri TaxID=77586 RepID=A0A0D9XEA1_9ORYZ